MRRLAALAIACGLAIGSLSYAEAAQAVTSDSAVTTTAVSPSALKYKFKNCTALHKVYPHGVGKSNAVDKTSGRRVTNFKHSTSLYKKIIGYHKGLDRDHDGIACEKH